MRVFRWPVLLCWYQPTAHASFGEIATTPLSVLIEELGFGLFEVVITAPRAFGATNVIANASVRVAMPISLQDFGVDLRVPFMSIPPVTGRDADLDADSGASEHNQSRSR